MILNEFCLQTEGLDRDLLLAIAEEYLGVNVIVIKNLFHCLSPFCCSFFFLLS